ncbi:hypothetical protein BC826DRAFT_454737 [Russula brevipes]|nr:hypothetical protein BC826DRAFT_454737 [Russula brevipes]
MSSHNHTRKSVQSPVTANIVVQVALPGATPTDGPSEVSLMGEHSIHLQEEFNGPRGLCQATIDKLPDDVLLEIFDFYLDNKNLDWRRNVDEWHTLVHVCQRWRNVVFASPRRLDLRLLCRKGRPVRAMLDIWPALPLNIKGFFGGESVDSLVAALEHRDRVRSIHLEYVPSPQGERLVATALQVQFPELTEMRFWTCGPVLPDSFLGGSAPRLRILWLTNVPFPAARALILSARDLVDLRLDDIPQLGYYIPPASMVACLSSLNKLESLSLGFESPPSQPGSPPQSRVVLPALIKFLFRGRREYSEDLVARIDTPVLNQLNMTFFPKPPFGAFDIPYLKQFIDRAKGLKPSKAAELRISPWSIHLDLHGPSLGVTCDRFDWQRSSFALLCGQVSHLLSLVERLDLPPVSPSSKSFMMSIQFLEIFRLFTSTRSLHVREDLMPLIASALHELIGERATEVLPNLCDLFLETSARSGSIQEVIQPFIDARRLSGRPVAVHYLEEAQKVGR